MQKQENSRLMLSPSPREAKFQSRTCGLQCFSTLKGGICHFNFDGVQLAQHCLGVDVQDLSYGGQSVSKGGLDITLATMLGMLK